VRIPSTRLEARFLLLQRLNAAVTTCLPLLDPTTAGQVSGLAHQLSECRGLVMRGVKDLAWAQALEATKAPEQQPKFDLRLSKSRALKFKAVCDHDGRHSLFSQALRQMGGMPSGRFRAARGTQLYNCVLEGERAHDMGGPYRESWLMFAEELQSPALPLLIRCPNSTHATGQNRDRWVMNPRAISPTCTAMLVFLGKLMGMALRTGEPLPFSLASLVWKQLVQQRATLDDLEAVDSTTVRSMAQLRTIDRQGVSEEMFPHVIFETFTVLSPGTDEVVELVPGGAAKAVTFRNR
jgi:hypothetical protein